MSSATAFILDGPFGNHNTSICTTTDLNLRKNPILEESREICCAILEGRDNVSVGASASDLMAYAVGCMIAKLYENGHLEDYDQAFRSLAKIYTKERMTGDHALRFSRRTVFDHLQASHLIPMSASIADAKRVGTLPTVAEIAKVVETHTQISLEKIKSKARAREYIFARFITIWVMRHGCGKSLLYIGEQIGNRDHTTILNGVKQMMLWRKNDIAIRHQVDDICDEADLVALRRYHAILMNQANIRKI